MKVLLAYVEEFTPGNLMERSERIIKRDLPGAVIDKIDYAKCTEIPFENNYEAIVLLGQARFVPPVAFKRILRKEEAKKIPVYMIAEHTLFPGEQREWYLKKDTPFQPGVCKLELLNEEDQGKMYITGLFPGKTIAH